MSEPRKIFTALADALFGEPKRIEFFVELAPGGPWLKNDLTCTPNWDERGLWPSIEEAETACTQSLKQNEHH